MLKDKDSWLGYVISHTHWDREWYLTFQEFRIKLVKLIDHLLKILDENPGYKYFHLDGQTIVLKDYLEIRPENEEKLSQYIRTGRILVGPWYVQPDEFLVSGESLIRNLIRGTEIAEKFGKVMKIGYLPDSFGHISQMPQILQGFGINNAIVGRGMSVETTKHTEFYWISPDGSKILTILLAFWYGNLRSLPLKSKDALCVVEKAINQLLPYASTPYLLLMNGVDHLEPQKELPSIIKKVNSLLPEGKLTHSTINAYLEKIEGYKPILRQVKGELREKGTTGIKPDVKPGTISSRIYLKQKNYYVEKLLEKWSEPWATFAWRCGRSYPDSFLRTAWEYLLQNHAHDSICGCSIDQVHREMEHRFSQAQQIAEDISQQSLELICSKIDTSGLLEDEQALVVFNPLNWSRTDLVTATIDFPIKKKIKNLILKDDGGKIIPLDIEEQTTTLKQLLSPFHTPLRVKVKRFKISFLAKNVPPCGYKTYRICISGKKENYFSSLVNDGKSMENEYLRVKIRKNGTIELADKKTGKRYQNCNYFEDSGDAGDGYYYVPPAKNKIITSLNKRADIVSVKKGTVRITFQVQVSLKLPIRLDKSRKKRLKKMTTCPLTNYVTLTTGLPRLEIKTVLRNETKDHRLRVVFPCGINTKHSFAEGHYDVVQREIRSTNIPMTNPQSGFVDLSDGKNGLTISNISLPEYEVIGAKEKTIALTLLRAVGMVSNGGRGCPVWETFDGQCQGKHCFKYALIPHSGDWESSKVYKQSHEFNVPMRAISTERHNGLLPSKLSFLTVQPDTLVISAIKKAEEGNLLVARFWNISNRKVQGKIASYFKIEKAYLLTMEEKIASPIRTKDNRAFFLTVPAKKILTIGLFLKEI